MAFEIFDLIKQSKYLSDSEKDRMLSMALDVGYPVAYLPPMIQYLLYLAFLRTHEN